LQAVFPETWWIDTLPELFLKISFFLILFCTIKDKDKEASFLLTD
jgi:hypothetical protein